MLLLLLLLLITNPNALSVLFQQIPFMPHRRHLLFLETTVRYETKLKTNSMNT